MAALSLTRLLTKIRHSRKALAIPMTFLMLFVSMLGIISITYYFAVEKVSSQSQTLKISTIKQDMQTLDSKILSILWQPGSAETFEFGDSGGAVKVQPSANLLTINVTDNRDVAATVFNGAIGQVAYELPYAKSIDVGVFLKGDKRTITNQSGSTITQLHIENGITHPQVLLQYRPTVSYATAGVSSDKAVNNLRIYIVNMNSSDSVDLMGKIPLKISCSGAQVSTLTYNLSYVPESLLVTSSIGDVDGQVLVPIASTDSGAIINLQTVFCEVKIERGAR